MTDDRDGAGSPVEDAVEDAVDDGDARGKTAVVTRPQRPTGKRPRRAVVEDALDDDDEPDTDSKSTKNGDGKKPKTAKKPGPEKCRTNPITFVLTFLKQVVAELRKVIWPNRKQMISYTTVVLVFLAFMVALIGGVDYGLARLVSLVFS